ncbi:MAG TPA: DUF2185 domain-containing protein [Desulfobacterales bacterium]|nr:DUF2185 domain-containing protein [Desulfobacterales bacterium]HIP40384.1 DUF2185 domain-containing protein [Desulfocapsa sulfexigens]
MISIKQNTYLKTAAIVCGHIAKQGLPILSAFRTEPESLEDSGWQFFCGKAEEDPDLAQVWLLEEVLKFEPSLAEYIDLQPGAQVWRSDKNEAWRTTG